MSQTGRRQLTTLPCIGSSGRDDGSGSLSQSLSFTYSCWD